MNRQSAATIMVVWYDEVESSVSTTETMARPPPNSLPPRDTHRLFVRLSLPGGQHDAVFDPHAREFPQVVSWEGRSAFPAQGRPETPAPQPAAPSGIDYLRLVDTAHQQHLAAQINYAALTDDADPAADIP